MNDTPFGACYNGGMDYDQKAKALRAINRHGWFHARPAAAPDCYTQRGRFYAATYTKACEYGKPFLHPDRLVVASPLIGESDETDEVLFGHVPPPPCSYKSLCRLEAKRMRRAVELGYDSLLLLPDETTERFLKRFAIPAKAELTLFDLRLSVGPASEPVFETAFAHKPTTFDPNSQGLTA